MNNSRLIEIYVKDSNQLLIDIDRQLEEAAVEDLPIITLGKEQEFKREVSNGLPKHSSMESILDRLEQKFRDDFCDQFSYCNAREKYADTVALIQAVGDSLIAINISFPIPIVTVASYCVLSMFLDRICDC